MISQIFTERIEESLSHLQQFYSAKLGSSDHNYYPISVEEIFALDTFTENMLERIKNYSLNRITFWDEIMTGTLSMSDVRNKMLKLMKLGVEIDQKMMSLLRSQIPPWRSSAKMVKVHSELKIRA